MAKRSLLSRAKISEFQKGIHDDTVITKIDIKDRKGKNGPINKMIYIKFAQMNATGKRISESELAWWKPDPTSDHFVTNLQEMCLQLHNILEMYIGEDEAYEAFKDVFAESGISDEKDIHNKKWKQSEVNLLNQKLKDTFVSAMDDVDMSKKFRIKLTTNYKGEDIEIPKYNKFIEALTVETTELKFTASELKTHSKSGIIENREASSSMGSAGTI